MAGIIGPGGGVTSGSYGYKKPPGGGGPSPMPAPPGATPTAPGAPPAAAAPVATQVTGPPAPTYQAPQQYQPMNQTDPNLGTMADFGKGLMDPDSPYYQRLVEQMRGQIGAQSQAAQRAASLRNVWGGGSGGGELGETQGAIGQRGLEMAGNAAADMRLKAPLAGAGMLQSTFNPTQQQFGLAAQQAQYGHQAAQQAGQFGAGLASGQWGQGQNFANQQQQMAMQQAQAQSQLDMQRYLAELNAYSGMF